MTEETQEQTGPVEEKQLNFDPKEVEAQLVKMANERAEDPVETAASTYRMYLPYYEASLKKLSVRGMRRLVNFLVKYPLEQDDIKAATPFEREMMELTNTLVQAKFVMILATYNEHADKFYEAATTPLTAEQEAEIAVELGVDNQATEVVESGTGE
jgi:superfamily II DNA or RNA helicase